MPKLQTAVIKDHSLTSRIDHLLNNKALSRPDVQSTIGCGDIIQNEHTFSTSLFGVESPFS